MSTSDSIENRIEKSNNWDYSSPNGEYRIIVSFIDHHIVHLEVIGYASITTRDYVWPHVEALIEKKQGQNKYYLIHDFSKVKGNSPRSRYTYIKWLKERSNQILQVYFYTVSPILASMIRAGMILTNRSNYVFIKKNLEEVLSGIEIHQNKLSVNNDEIWDLSKKKDVLFDDWIEGRVFKSRSGNQYKVHKKWYHKHEECSTITYFLNEDVVVRMYIGDFEDDTIGKVEESMIEVLKEAGLWRKPYHFYIDFSKTTSLSLKYRKDAVSWYINESAYLLSVGFLHLKPFQKIAVSIARRIAVEATREKIFILNDAAEIFDTVENASKIKRGRTQEFKELNKLS